MVRLITLGSVALYDREGTHLSGEATQSKRLALLAYLATGSGLHRRDKLVALFWPESDHARARASLNRAVHYLRSLLGEESLPSVGREAIRVDLSHVHVDAWHFRRALESGDFETALSLYRGEFLDGVFLTGLQEFDEWVEVERRTLRAGAESAARHLTDAAVVERDWEQALGWARRAVELAPLDEGAVRRLIHVTAQSGDRVGALRIFESFEATLASEVGIEPPDEIRALVDGIREPPADDGPRVPAAGRARGAGVARRREGSSPAAPDSRPRRAVARRLLGGVRIGLPVAAVVLSVMAVELVRSGRGGGGPGDVSVAVFPFRNRTGDPSLGPFVTALEAEIVQRVATSVSAVVVSADSPPGPEADPGAAPDEVRAAGGEPGPTLAVTGDIHARGDSLAIHARVTDARASHPAHVLAPVAVARTGAVGSLGEMADRVAAAVASHVDLGPEASLYTPPASVEAHREFRRGVELHAAGQGRRAIVHLTRAAELDPGFTRSLLSAAHAHNSAGRRDEAARVLSLLQRMRGTLRPLEVRELDYHLAAAGDDVEQTLGAVRRLAELAPATWSHEAGLWELRVNRPVAALTYFERFVPGASGDGTPDRARYWSARSAALHRLGRDDEALRIAMEGRRRFPESHPLLEREIAALAGLGRVDQVMDHIWVGATNHQWLCGWRAALELRAHGHPDAALQAARSAAGLSTDPFLRLRVVLHFEGREAEASSRMEELVQANPDDVDYVGMSGVLAARRGDFAAILGADRRLELWGDPGARGRNTLWRAKIAAARGERVTALRLLSQAHVEGMYFSESLHRDIELEPLRGYHAFEEFLRPRDGAEGGRSEE